MHLPTALRLILIAVWLLVPSALAAEPARALDFAADILPIFRSNCLACHNVKDAKGDLVLETPAGIRKGGESGPAAEPGKADASQLLQSASHLAKPFMPPKNNKVGAEPLKPAQLAIIKLWIDQGMKGDGVVRKGPIEWQPLPEGLNPILAVAVTPDGQFAACSRANQIFIYHIPSRQLVTRLTDDPAKLGLAHRDLVQSLAFSNDGKLLASGGYREVKLWQRPEPAVRLSLADIAAKTIAVSPNGKLLAAAGEDNLIRLFEMPAGKPLRQLAGHAGAISSLQFSADSAKLFSASADKSICVWNAADGTRLGKIDTPAAVSAMTILGDGRIVTGAPDNVLRVWDAANPQPLRSITGHTAAITTLALVPGTPSQFISGSLDGTVRRWNAADGKPLLKPLNHGGPVSAVAVRPDGKRIVSAGPNHIAKLWDAADGRELASIRGDRDANQLAQQRERALAAANAEVAYFKARLDEATKRKTAETLAVTKAADARTAAEKAKTESEKAFAEKTAAAKALADAPDKKEVASKLKQADKAAADAEKIFKQAQQAFTSLDKALLAAKASLAKDEKEIAAAKDSQQSADARATQGKADLDAARKAAADAEQPITTVAFSPDNLTLFTAGPDGLVRSWSADTGLACETLRGHAGAVLALAMAPDGSILSASADRSVKIWDTSAAWKLLRTLGSDADSSFVGRVSALAFSPDNAILVTGGGIPSRSGELKLWAISTGSLLREISDAHSDTIYGLSFSGDGKLLASCAADKFVKVFSMPEGKLIRPFEGHTHHVLGVSFRHDGRMLLSAGADNVMKLWDVVAGEQKKTITGYNAEITSVHYVGFTDSALITTGDGQVRLIREDGGQGRNFDAGGALIYAAAVTPDGLTILAGGDDGILRLWDGRDGKPLAVFAPPRSAPRTGEQATSGTRN
jgi:WD40 repeat protein